MNLKIHPPCSLYQNVMPEHYGMFAPRFLYPLISPWTLRLFLTFGYWEYCNAAMIMGVQISFWVPLFNSFEYKPEVELLDCVVIMGFPGDSDGKESACNEGDQGLIPVSGRSLARREWWPTPVIMCLVSLGPVAVFCTGAACYILAAKHQGSNFPTPLPTLTFLCSTHTPFKKW